jgi:phospholipid-translocating P-type ATPase (flippase)
MASGERSITLEHIQADMGKSDEKKNLLKYDSLGPSDGQGKSYESYASVVQDTDGASSIVVSNAPEPRVIHFNDSDTNGNRIPHFSNNLIKTSKYTVASFLPKFLFETFRKLANAYFLMVSVMQCIPPISNTDGVPTALPTLLFIISVDAVFAILEDRRRHKSDATANGAECHVYNQETADFQDDYWRNVVVGDIVKIKNREVAPADVLILGVSDSDTGLCYVETKSLDGETNLKVRQGLEDVVKVVQSEADLKQIRGSITCEAPNNIISNFSAVLRLEGNAGVGTTTTCKVEIDNLVLRGCTVRNTEYVYGLVLTTGVDTKIMQAATDTPSKLSSLDKKINVQILWVVLVLFCFCLCGALGSSSWEAVYLDDQWYLRDSKGDAGDQIDSFITRLFYYFLLMYQFIPISLYVSMSMVKYAQAFFMELDLAIYHEETDSRCVVRSMGLNDELGVITHVFSDKTGTLTCNVMDFRKCSINGKSYGEGTTEIGLARLKRMGLHEEADKLKSLKPDADMPQYVNFIGRDLIEELKTSDRDGSLGDLGTSGSQGPVRTAAQDFFTVLAVCHTIIPEVIDGETSLSASSPDEQALVAGAAFFGYEFVGRTPGTAMVKGRTLDGEDLQFEVLCVLEFNSKRKRMSVVVREPPSMGSRLRLYTKGADSVIYPLIAETPEMADLKITTLAHMVGYADDGLRTLVIAAKDLDEEWFVEWYKAYNKASGDLEQIERKKKDLPNDIDDVEEKLEAGLTLLGATAIEDKLQDGVPDCIAKLRAADMNVWMLTGDKMETAINIAFACQLLTTEMRRFEVSFESVEHECIQDMVGSGTGAEVDVDVTEKKIVTKLRKTLAAAIEEATKCAEARTSGTATTKCALVVDGLILTLAMEKCRQDVIDLTLLCSVVVACRVSPAQKQEMVEMVRENVPSSITLAIGDGANDVPMIQAAHVGVGISGQEGLQAANSADFSIAQFRFLEDLLLKHGRFNLRRMSKLICYMFYKNILLTVVQFYYTIQTGFSGQKMYSEYGIQVYNVNVTAFPIILLAIFDRDVSNRHTKLFPQLYAQGAKGEYFNPTIFWGWVLTSIVESALIIIFVFFTLTSSDASGEDGDLWQMGTVAYFLVVWIANLKVGVQQYLWIWLTPFFLFGGVLVWIATGSLVSSVYLLEPSYFGVFLRTLSLPAFWLAVILAPVLILGRDIVWKFIKRNMYPEVYHIVSEISAFGDINSEGTPSQSQLQKEDDLTDYFESRGREGENGSAGSRAKNDAAPDFSIIADDDKISRRQFVTRSNSGFAYSNDQASTSVESRMVSSGHSFQHVIQVQQDMQLDQNGVDARSRSSF